MGCDCEVVACEKCVAEAEALGQTSAAIFNSMRKVPHQSAKALLNHFDEFMSLNFRGLSARARGDGAAESFKIEFADGSDITWSRGK